MSSLPEEKLAVLVERWTMIQEEMNANADQKAFVRLSKEFASLDPVVATIRELQGAEAEAEDLKALIGRCG